MIAADVASPAPPPGPKSPRPTPARLLAAQAPPHRLARARGTAGPRRALLALWLVAASALPADPLHAATCPAGQTALFTCQAPSGPITLCATPGGAPTAILGGETFTGLTRAQRMFGGGGETQIAFAAHGTRIVLFSRTLRTGFAADGHNDPQDSTGLLHEKDGHITDSANCGGSDGAALDAPALRALPSAAPLPHP